MALSNDAIKKARSCANEIRDSISVINTRCIPSMNAHIGDNENFHIFINTSLTGNLVNQGFRHFINHLSDTNWESKHMLEKLDEYLDNQERINNQNYT